jgi:hypothetical protein
MPPVSPIVAHQVMNMRLKAFANNPENPRQIDKLFIERIHKGLEVSGQPLNFRRIIRATLDEFEAGHFDPLLVNPVKIPASTLNTIKSTLESNPMLRRQLHKLLFGSHEMNLYQRTQCLKHLVRIYASSGMYDLEIKPSDAPFIYRLAEANLIVKTFKSAKLYWQISPALDYDNKQVIKQHNLSMEDFLLKIYGSESEIKGQPKARIQEIDVIDTFLQALPKTQFHDLLVLAKGLHSDIISSADAFPASSEKVREILRKSTASLGALTRAYHSFEQVQTLPVSDEVILQFWEDFWFSPSEIMEYNRLRNAEHDNPSFAPLAISLYREAFPVILNFIKAQFEKSRQLPIPLNGLKNEEIKTLNDIRDEFISLQYFEVASKLSKLIETKLRSFLYNVFALLYGDRDNRLRMLDNNSKSYIIKNISSGNSSGFSEPANEFQHLNRANYKDVMTGIKGSVSGRARWLHIFSTVFYPWSERDLYDYLDLFAEINTKVSHNSDDSIRVEQQGLIYSFLVKSIQLMIKINGMYPKLLKGGIFKRAGASVTFSLCDFKDENLLKPCNMNANDLGRLADIFGEKTLKVPLDNQDYIREYFGIEYRNFIATITSIINQTDEDLKRTKKRMVVKDNRLPEVSLQLIPSL